jgi:hypothetical protein
MDPETAWRRRLLDSINHGIIPSMRLTQLSGECPDGTTCPAVFATDVGTAIVQGRRPDPATLALLRLAQDEYAVEVPVELLREVAGRC